MGSTVKNVRQGNVIKRALTTATSLPLSKMNPKAISSLDNFQRQRRGVKTMSFAGVEEVVFGSLIFMISTKELT